MAGIDMGVFIEKLHGYEPTEIQKGKDEFTTYFLPVFDILHNTASIAGFARNLDMDQVSYEDLDWILCRVEETPSAEVGGYYGEVDEGDLLRDRAFKLYFSEPLNLRSFFKLKAYRPVEEYF